jgi:hypothetical protein
MFTGRRKANEFNAAYARLARGWILSQHSPTVPDQEIAALARQRVIELCRPDAGTEETLFSRMLQILREGRPTINLDPADWFLRKDESDRYLNAFEKKRYSAMDPSYMSQRDKIEMEIANYDGARDWNGPLQDTAYFKEKIAQYGLTTSPYFQGQMRPRYGALDFAHCRYGGAGGRGYGNCYLVLKEYLKHTAIYLHTDSYWAKNDIATRAGEYNHAITSTRDVAATYFELEKILLYCPPSLLQHIFDYAVGRKILGSERALSAHALCPNYIEMQLQSDVLFGRDVERLMLCKRSLADLTLDQQTLVQKNIARFSHKHGVPVQYV